MPEHWQRKKVLVTGAGGFIGSHLVGALVERGAEVRAFVRYNSRGDPGLLRMLDARKTESIELVIFKVEGSRQESVVHHH